MAGNMSFLTDFEEIDGGYFTFEGIPSGGKQIQTEVQLITKSKHFSRSSTRRMSDMIKRTSLSSTKASDDAGKARMETVPGKDYILLPLWPVDPLLSQISKSSLDAGFKPLRDNKKKVTEEPRKEGGDSSNDQENSTVNAVGIEVNAVGAKTSIELPDDQNMPKKEDNVNNTNNVILLVMEIALTILMFIKLPDDPNMPELEYIVYLDDVEDVGAEADMNNLNTFILISPILTTRIHKDHPMDVKSAFLYGKIEEEVYVYQPPGFEDPDFPDRVYKVEKTLYGLHQAPKACQDKYVTEILKKFGLTDVKTASTPMETQKPLLKDEDGEEVDVYLYRSMIGSLMYLTSSKPDIMFTVCACARYQVDPKVSHLHAVKRIFRYLKGQPKLGLWYPKDSPFDLVAYTNSDYARASLDRKSTTGGCQFLRCRLILWQCKKPTVVANSTTEAEYVAASSCCGQVLWIQNQLLDYGYNFMHTKIYINNKSTICIVKNPVFYSKTKDIEIRHHFIRDSNEKKLIQIIKIHTDKNVADFLTKAFDIVDFLNACSIKYALTVNPTIYTSCIQQFWSTVKAKIVNGVVQLQALVDRKKIVVAEATVRRDLQLEDADGVDCLPNATIFKQLTLIGKQKSRRPKEKDTQAPQSSAPSDPTNIADKAVTKDLSMQLKELMDFCTKLQQRVLDLKNTKTAQAHEITSLKKRVKKLEKKGGSRTHKIIQDWIDMAKNPTATIITNIELTLAQTLAELKSTRPKTTIPSIDKGKGIMVKESLKIKKKDQVLIDEQEAIRLQAQFDEEERIARDKEEANAALIAQWNDIQS
ncbi:putative reverse transcriptase, RNA-dependent DNA polymerase [Tanacetum coccineum]